MFFINKKGRNVNVTLCFNPMQALMAARAGAKYISPFIGRMEDNGFDGVELISNIRTIFDNYAISETLILAASIRSSKHIVDSALAGADRVSVVDASDPETTVNNNIFAL